MGVVLFASLIFFSYYLFFLDKFKLYSSSVLSYRVFGFVIFLLPLSFILGFAAFSNSSSVTPDASSLFSGILAFISSLILRNTLLKYLIHYPLFYTYSVPSVFAINRISFCSIVFCFFTLIFAFLGGGDASERFSISLLCLNLISIFFFSLFSSCRFPLLSTLSNFDHKLTTIFNRDMLISSLMLMILNFYFYNSDAYYSNLF